MCQLLVGLADVELVGVEEQLVGPLRIHVRSTLDQAWCMRCGVRAGMKDWDRVPLVDLPFGGRPARLVWHKQRWVCREAACDAGSWRVIDERICPPRFAMTARAARWVCRQVGEGGRSVSSVASELDCDWHTANDAVMAYGEALLAADVDRVGMVDALGLDETMFVREGPRNIKAWATSIVDVGGDHPPKLIEVIEGRTAVKVSAWLDSQPAGWRGGIRYGTLDMSGPYRKVFSDSLPHVTQVADPFHVAKHANLMLDECRRRVQNETLGHRGHKADPLYRARRLLTKAHERLDGDGEAKLLGLLEAGDPHGEVRMCWHAKETIRGLYAIADPDLAAEFLDELVVDMADDTMPLEVRSLAGTLRRWREQILAWHTARVSNGPTEGVNNIIKLVKRVGFGFRNFRHYRIRVLLRAGRPTWDLLATITPR